MSEFHRQSEIYRNVCFVQTLFSVAVLFLLVSSSQADEKKTPLTIPETIKVTAEELIEIVNATPDIVVVDSRIRGDRRKGYIEGSVSLPDIDTTCKSLQAVIPNNTTTTLFYCNGVKCGRSVKAIKIAQGCGYKNIYWFRGGFEEWLDKEYPFLKE